MSNFETDNETVKLRLLISNMSNSPIPEDFTIDDLKEIINFVDMIFITDSAIVNKFGEKYQQLAVQICRQISELITRNRSIQDNESLIDEISKTINSYHNFKSSTRDSSLLLSMFKKALRRVKQLGSKLENNMLFIEDNSDKARDFQRKLQKLDSIFSQYILAGEIKLYQVNQLFKDFDNGDRSKIKNANDKLYIKQCADLFKSKLESLKLTQTTCLQHNMLLKSESTNNDKILASIRGIIQTTIPAFEEEKFII